MPQLSELEQAIELLGNSHLVWSEDFEAIRLLLLSLLDDESRSLAPHQSTLELARELIDGYHNDFRIG